VKIRIQAEPGELEVRRADVERVLRQLGEDPICKAGHGDQSQRKLDYKVMQDLVDRGRRRQTERIRRLMLKRIQEIIG
jgi:hypothetical protein